MVTKDAWDDYDWCYECTGYGDDYSVDEKGELVSNCEKCPYNKMLGCDDDCRLWYEYDDMQDEDDDEELEDNEDTEE